MDYMPDGNMHDYIKGSRLAGGSQLPPVDLLRIAAHVSIVMAVAGMNIVFFLISHSCYHRMLKKHSHRLLRVLQICIQ